MKLRDRKIKRRQSNHPRRRAYPIRNHLVNSPPRAPESHDLFGLGIVGQIVNHLGIVYLLIRRLDSSDTGDCATKCSTKRWQRLRVVVVASPFFFVEFPLVGENCGRSKIVCAALHWLGLAGAIS
jgi:hypothetical protein